jgi:hypothetical protein
MMGNDGTYELPTAASGLEGPKRGSGGSLAEDSCASEKSMIGRQGIVPPPGKSAGGSFDGWEKSMRGS